MSDNDNKKRLKELSEQGMALLEQDEINHKEFDAVMWEITKILFQIEKQEE